MKRFLVFMSIISMLLIGCPVKDSTTGVDTAPEGQSVQPAPAEPTDPAEPAGDVKESPAPDAVEPTGDIVEPEEDQVEDGGDIGC